MSGTNGGADTVARWNAAARAYERFASTWAPFGEFADRLIDELPGTFDGVAVDVGAGTGLVAARLRARRPAARVWLVEPAEAMLAIARERLGDAIEGAVCATAEELSPRLPDFDAALSSAALHLADLERVIGAVARRLRPGGLFAFNLWGHSFAETAARGRWGAWRGVLDRALARHGHGVVRLPESAGESPVTRAEIEAWAAAAGLRARITVDPLALPVGLSLDCAALFEGFLGALDPSEREAVLATARALGDSEATAATMVRVRLDG